MTQSVEGGKMYKIRVRDMRIPEESEISLLLDTDKRV